jgi:small-conductance mechanosensitive channel
MEQLLETTYGGNSVRAYLVAAAITVGIVLAVRITVYLIVKRLAALAARTETSLDDTLIKVLGATRSWLALVVAIDAGSQLLVLPGQLGPRLRVLAVIAVLLQIGVWGTTALTAAAVRLREKKIQSGETSGLAVISMIGLFGRIVAWAIIFILVLDNLGVDITALVAGLGIGGIAVALALQSVLSDAFASVAIMLDRPFEVGDTIQVADMVGTVEHIGLKTTRLRALSGEQMVFANNDLLSSRVRNYKRMAERRTLFAIGVTYQTPIDRLERIPALVRQIIEKEPRARFDRAHFKSFGASSLDFEIVYFVTTPEYLVFMDTQQRVNLEILRQLGALGVEFAYPTQTVYEYKLGGPAAPPQRAAG